MIEPWFPAAVTPWLAYLSFFALVGTLEIYVKQGRHRAAVTLAYRATLAIGGLLFLAGTAGWLLGQPDNVVRPLCWSGLVMIVALGWSLWTLDQRYATAELRRIAASDM